MVHQFMGAWFDAASALIAFCRHSTVSKHEVDRFQHTVVRLMSLLNAVCFEVLEGVHNLDENNEEEGLKNKDGFQYALIDVAGLDKDTLRLVQDSRTRVETCFQMLQSLIVDAIAKEIVNVPAPIVSPTLEEIGTGMCKFHAASCITDVPFPFPYVVITEVILFLYALYSPFMIAFWAKGAVGTVAFTFLLIFSFWFLNGMAGELDNPFGSKLNDLDMDYLHCELNERLLSLLPIAHSSPPAMKEDASILIDELFEDAHAEKQEVRHRWSVKLLRKSIKSVKSRPSRPSLNSRPSLSSEASWPSEEGAPLGTPQGSPLGNRVTLPYMNRASTFDAGIPESRESQRLRESQRHRASAKLARLGPRATLGDLLGGGEPAKSSESGKREGTRPEAPTHIKRAPNASVVPAPNQPGKTQDEQDPERGVPGAMSEMDESETWTPGSPIRTRFSDKDEEWAPAPELAPHRPRPSDQSEAWADPS